MDRYGNEGPNQKNLSDLTLTLTDTTPKAMVSFYTRLQHAVMIFGLGLVPFDAIKLALGHVILCHPRLGTNMYQSMSRALCTTLQNYIIPKDARITNLFSIIVLVAVTICMAHVYLVSSGV